MNHVPISSAIGLVAAAILLGCILVGYQLRAVCGEIRRLRHAVHSPLEPDTRIRQIELEKSSNNFSH
jgi:hypothetical protein